MDMDVIRATLTHLLTERQMGRVERAVCGYRDGKYTVVDGVLRKGADAEYRCSGVEDLVVALLNGLDVYEFYYQFIDRVWGNGELSISGKAKAYDLIAHMVCGV